MWLVRTAKGGAPRAFWLNDDMVAAWKAFIAADAWGAFDGSDYATALYAAGWPRDVRPYQARHSVALELGERGIDLGDVQGGSATSTFRRRAGILRPCSSAD